VLSDLLKNSQTGMGLRRKRFGSVDGTFSLLVKASEKAAEVSLGVLEAYFGMLHA
jgi:hypothetical protein